MDSIAALKRCTKCGETDPTKFGKNRSTPDGLQRWCRACRSAHAHKPEVQARKAAYDLAYGEANSERIRARARERYHTDDAYRARVLDYSHRRSRSEIGHEDNKRRHARRWADPEYRQNRVAEHRERRKRSAEYREYLREWKRKSYQDDPERHRSYVARFMQTPAGKALQARANHRRRLREQQAPTTLTAAEWQSIIDHQEGRCLACGRLFTDELPPCRDHIVPVSLGGALTADNCQALCRPCNSSKRTKVIDYRPLRQVSME